MRLQKKLDILLPEREQLKELAATLRKERDHEKKINEEVRSAKKIIGCYRSKFNCKKDFSC